MKIVFKSFGIIVICFLGACQLIIPFKEPPAERFSYFLKKNPTQIFSLNYKGVYYFEYEDKSKENFSYNQYFFRFLEDGSIYYINSAPSKSIDSEKAWLNEKKSRKSKYRKGYFLKNNDSLNIEIAVGSPSTGFYFIYFEGKIISKDKIIIKQVNKIRRFRIAMKQVPESLVDSALAIPQEFQFSPF